MFVMNRNEIMKNVRSYLAKHLNCSVEELQKNDTVFVANDNKNYPFLEICTMGQAVIVSASSAIIPQLQNLFKGKSRDEIFECPFIYGQSIFYIPDDKMLRKLPFNPGFEYELLQGDEIQKLKDVEGFDNSLTFDESGRASACIVLCAMKGKEIVALAGASQESEKMWEVGVDVKPAYRNRGLATTLVNNLACTILEQGIVPFYCASTTNVGSQAVAHRSGFIPCWVSTYRTILDGSSAYHEIVGQLYLP